MPVSVYSFEKIFGRYDVLFLPNIIEFWSHNLQIFFELNVVFFVLKKKPYEYELLIEVFGWFEDLHSGSLFGIQVFHVENVSYKCICHLPRGVYFYEVRNVVVNGWEDFVLNRRLILLESFARKYFFIFLRFILLELIKIDFTHFPFDFPLNIQSFLKLLETIFKFSVITVFNWCLFIGLYLLFAKNFTKFFSNDHQWFKGFLYRFCDSLDKGVLGKNILWFGNIASLEHLLPYLVWRHKEAYADSLYWNILDFQVYVSELSLDVLLHSLDKLINIGLVKSELGIFLTLVKISNGMMMEPNLKKVHENLSAGCVGPEKLISFDFPLFFKFIGDLLHENGVLVESILIFLVFKEREIWVVKNLIFLFPDEVVPRLLSWKGFASSSIFFVLHLEDSVFNIALEWRNFKKKYSTLFRHFGLIVCSLILFHFSTTDFDSFRSLSVYF